MYCAASVLHILFCRAEKKRKSAAASSKAKSDAASKERSKYEPETKEKECDDDLELSLPVRDLDSDRPLTTVGVSSGMSTSSSNGGQNLRGETQCLLEKLS